MRLHVYPLERLGAARPLIAAGPAYPPAIAAVWRAKPFDGSRYQITATRFSSAIRARA